MRAAQRRGGGVAPVRAAEAAPARRSEPASWADPSDPLATRTPPTIKGRARGQGTVARLHRRGSPEITVQHVEAAHRLLCAWDGSRTGYSPRALLGERTGGVSAGPLQGPGAAALHQHTDSTTVARALRAVGPAAIPMVKHVVIEGHDLQSWARLRTEATGHRVCVKACMGRLLAALDHLVVALDVPSSGGLPVSPAASVMR